MNCRDFETSLDLYLDGELDAHRRAMAAEHVGACPACDGKVIAHQKIRALLTTAVADRAAAVDVSGLWNEIETRLAEPTTGPLASLAGARIRRALTRARHTHWSAWTAVAAAAAVVFALLLGAQRPAGNDEIARLHGGLVQSRPVRIDSMEVAAGHTVSTWVKPRTKTRVIWVASTSGSTPYGVANAGGSR